MRLAWKILLVICGVIVALGLYIELQMHSAAVPRYGKGGFGIIGNDLSVVTRGRQNIVWKNNLPHWTDDTVGERRTVFLPPLLINFQTDRIQFFDFSTYRGGYYLRDINTLPPQVLKILDGADQFVFFSLFPVELRGEGPPPSISWNESFHDYPVLGKSEIGEKAERARLIQELNKSIGDSDGSFAACFMPRHGIHAALGNETVDLVICFECEQVYAYSASLPNTPDVYPITQSARQTFDEDVTAADLKSVR